MSKSRFTRTDRKLYVKQLAQIERRSARLHRLRAKLANQGLIHKETVPHIPDEHHHIGKGQNEPVHFGTFLRSNSGDPAIQVSLHLSGPMLLT
jgi:hypothetical protein